MGFKRGISAQQVLFNIKKAGEKLFLLLDFFMKTD